MVANRTTTNPLYIGTMAADVTFAGRSVPLTIKKIRCVSAGDGDIFQLEDADGNVIVHMVNTGVADTFELDFGDKGHTFLNGVVCDVTDCTGMVATDGTDAAWIYTA